MMRALRDSFRPAAPKEGAAVEGSNERRLTDLLKQYYTPVWRVVRRLGVHDASAEDLAQQVFVVASSKLEHIERHAERAFLLGTAARLAANHRRSAPVRYEAAEEDVGGRASDGPGADELLHEKRLRKVLDDVLGELPDDLRTVFVLFEVEELAVADIAAALEIPHGTAASRLRRAREAFAAAARRARARMSSKEK
jgi:RNA polymerase sigma-70 factor (ECF subfamily)